MKHSFEDYLEAIFIKNYSGIKDDATDAFDTWVSNLDAQELIDYADVYAGNCYEEGKKSDYVSK